MSFRAARKLSIDAPAAGRGFAQGDQGSTSYLGDCRNENTHTNLALIQSWQRRSPSPDRRMPSRRSESRGSGGSRPCLENSLLGFACCACTEFESGACADSDVRSSSSTSRMQLRHERRHRQYSDGLGIPRCFSRNVRRPPSLCVAERICSRATHLIRGNDHIDSLNRCP